MKKPTASTIPKWMILMAEWPILTAEWLTSTNLNAQVASLKDAADTQLQWIQQ
ncbi:hypothetical protein PtB15_8B220 [Puccinia triticina]|nr:hypothetical protein PtB15_8B220 [Puccinia triticina]